MALPSEFDPDKLHLTVEQIDAIGERLIARWSKNKQANYKMIIMTRAVRFLLRRYSRKEIEQYYKETLQEVFAVMQENTMAAAPELQMLKEVKEKREIAEKPKVRYSMLESIRRGGMAESG